MSRVPTLAAAALFMLASAPAGAFVNCAANPLQPMCCPAPCPVIDTARLAQLAGLSQAKADELTRWTVQLDNWRAVASTIGSTATPALSLRPQPATPLISRRVPGFANDISGPLLSTASRTNQERVDAAARLRVANLPSLSALAPIAAGTASPPTFPSGGPDPWRARTAARTGLYAQLADTAAASSGLLASALLGQSLAADATVVTPDAPAYSPVAPAKHSPFSRGLDLAGLVRGAISLNNAGVLVGQILSSLPLLQREVDRYNDVVAAQRGNTLDLATTLRAMKLYEDPDAAAAAILTRSRQLDPTRYVDNWTSSRSASQAVASIAQTLVTRPEEFGAVYLWRQTTGNDQALPPPDPSTVTPIVDAWLGNTKYGEFLAPIATTAVSLQGSARAVSAAMAQHYPVPLTPDAIAAYARAAAGQAAAANPGADVSALVTIAAHPAQALIKVR